MKSTFAFCIAILTLASCRPVMNRAYRTIGDRLVKHSFSEDIGDESYTQIKKSDFFARPLGLLPFTQMQREKVYGKYSHILISKKVETQASPNSNYDFLKKKTIYRNASGDKDSTVTVINKEIRFGKRFEKFGLRKHAKVKSIKRVKRTKAKNSRDVHKTIKRTEITKVSELIPSEVQ